MPLGDPGKSFEGAVRHLFRHVDDAEALRRNPLVQTFFGDGSNPKEDAAAVALIRARMLLAAESCRVEDVAGGQPVLARRRYEIVLGLCAGRSPEKVAKELNLSIRQYYRDRWDISMRVARRIVSSTRSTSHHVEVDEPLQLLFKRASSLVDEGFSGSSTTLLTGALRQIASPQAKVIALLGVAEAQVQFGDVMRARQAHEDAQVLFDQCCREIQDAAYLETRLLLTNIEVTLSSGRDAEAANIIDALVDDYEKREQEQSGLSGEALDIFLEACSLHLQNGRYNAARSSLSKALQIAKRPGFSSAESRLRANLAIFTAACVEDSADRPDQALALFEEALHLSLLAGSARFVGYAMLGLVRTFLRLGDENRAYHWFGKAVDVARSMEGTKTLISAAASGSDLLATRFWRDAGALLVEVRQMVPVGTLKWLRVRTGLGIYYARCGQLSESLTCLDEAQRLAEGLENWREASNILRERAIVLHRLGRVSDSTECIRFAVSVAESGTNALSLYKTYRAAAEILADEQMARLAHRMQAFIGRKGDRRALQAEKR